MKIFSKLSKYLLSSRVLALLNVGAPRSLQSGISMAGLTGWAIIDVGVCKVIWLNCKASMFDRGSVS